MFSVQQNYSRLFRPWDVSESKDVESDGKVKEKTDVNEVQRKHEKRENRLRKIRGILKKTDNNYQDATVSTTTVDSDEDKQNLKIPDEYTNIVDSPVVTLSQCCDRLLEEPEKEINDEKQNNDTKTSTESLYPNNIFSQNPIPPNLYGPGLAEYMSADIAQSLGIPPSDPLLLESLAQGYAMELEYARILHQENEAKLLNSRKQRPKKYKCPHCQVGFSNNGQLKGHIRIHTGERPYKCDEKNCGKTFTRNEELTRHKRIHSGVRPYPCPTCGKKFGRRDHLKKHTRTHYLQAERMMPVFVPLSAMPHGFPYLYSY